LIARIGRLPARNWPRLIATGEIAKSIPSRSGVVGCVVHAACSVDAPGVIRHKMGARLIIGEPSGGLTPRLQALHDALAAAGFEPESSDDIQRDVWFKLWGNMTMNPVSAITGATTDKILGRRAGTANSARR
jgi:2-dehydropantoate 2-reductase